MINNDKLNSRAIEIASIYGVTVSVATIILLNGYTLCQDDIIIDQKINILRR
jgi:hypothetical protein